MNETEANPWWYRLVRPENTLLQSVPFCACISHPFSFDVNKCATLRRTKVLLRRTHLTFGLRRLLSKVRSEVCNFPANPPLLYFCFCSSSPSLCARGKQNEYTQFRRSPSGLPADAWRNKRAPAEGTSAYSSYPSLADGFFRESASRQEQRRGSDSPVHCGETLSR